MDDMRFAIVIEKAERNFSAYAPDLPGCVATADSLEKCRREMRSAIAFHIEGLREEGILLSEPTTIVKYVDIT
jgi:predicted RNase H-like HicB family nuclease